MIHPITEYYTALETSRHILYGKCDCGMLFDLNRKVKHHDDDTHLFFAKRY